MPFLGAKIVTGLISAGIGGFMALFVIVTASQTSFFNPTPEQSDAQLIIYGATN